MQSSQDFLKYNNLLNFEVNHLNYGIIDDKGHSSNAIPMNRILIIPEESDSRDSYIMRKSQEDSKIYFKSGFLYFVPADYNLEFEFCPGLALGGAHFSLELLTGFDVFMAEKDIIEQQDRNGLGEEFWLYLNAPDSLAKTSILRGLLLSIVGMFIDKGREDLVRIHKIHEQYADLNSWLSQNIKAGISLDDLASLTGRSKQSLSRNFSKDMGLTLKDYMSRCLIKEISRRLVFSNLNMKEIAADLNFNDEYYFSRFFSKRTGLSPREYRALYKDNKLKDPYSSEFFFRTSI